MNNFYEKRGTISRMREAGTLFLFIFLSLVASLIVMNLLIFPIALFSVKNSIAFTFIVKYLFWITVAGALCYFFVKRIIFYRKNGFPNLLIIKNIILRPVYFILFLILILVIIFSLIALINIILQKNYYLIYKIIDLVSS